MRNCFTFWQYLILLTGLLCPAASAFCQTIADPTREEFQSDLLERRNQAIDILGSAPISHIIPRKHAIYVAAGFETFDLTIGPSSVKQDGQKAASDHYLSMDGWTANPFVAFAANRFGIGFAAESGVRNVEYLRRDSGHVKHQAAMEYSGVGVYGYFIPDLRLLPNYITPTLMVGGKNLAAVHEDYGTVFAQGTEATSQKRRYGVQKYEYGINLGISLVKKFTVFPWIHYERTLLGEVRDADGETLVGADDDETLALDRQLMWKNRRELRYSIDFAVRIQRVDIHLGGLLGLIGGLTAGADRIEDNGLSISGSYQL